MSNFLKNLLKIQAAPTTRETNKWIYNLSYLYIDIDLFIFSISFGVLYWVSRESFEQRNRWFNEYLENIFAQFELTEAAAPAPKKPAKKTPAKKPATKNKAKK
jgi:hypothetical protein